MHSVATKQPLPLPLQPLHPLPLHPPHPLPLLSILLPVPPLLPSSPRRHPRSFHWAPVWAHPLWGHYSGGQYSWGHTLPL